MIVSLKNIGTIQEASFDLDKDLIVFIGPNNTGKTYAAYTIYAIYRYATKGEKAIDFIGKELEIDFGSNWELGDASINIWEVFLKNEEAFSLHFPNRVNKLLNQVFDSGPDFFNGSEILLNFNHEQLNSLFRSTPFKSQIKYGGFSINFNKEINDPLMRIAVIFEGDNEELIGKFSESKGFKFLSEIIIPNFISTLIFQILFKEAYIAPAERIAINLFSRQLSVQRNRLVEDLLSLNTSNRANVNGTTDLLLRTKLYPLPIRDSLEISEQLVEYQKLESEFGYLADYFEREILNGKIYVSEFGEVRYTPSEINNVTSTPDKLKIIKANYGIDGNFEDFTGIIKSKGISLHKQRVTNKLFGKDPIPNVPKQLFLEWSFNDMLFSRNFREGDYIDLKTDDPNLKSLGIHLSASMVKSLSSLVFYFRHIAHRGDFIMIDEPELNLHPDNQRVIVRLLARIINAGFKVMISTHSDYIIRELNNLIMLNKEHPETKTLQEKYGYEESEILDHKRVGAYLFKDHTAKELEVTESGMEAATIDEEINKLNNTATDIYWTLFED